MGTEFQEASIKIAENIKRVRKEKGLTQNDLAKEVGISVTSIQAYEYGKTHPRITIALRIAKALGVSINDIDDRILSKQKSLSDYTMEELLSEIGRRLDNGTRKEL